MNVGSESIFLRSGGIESIEENLEIYTVFDGKPVESVENRCDVAGGRGFGDNTGSSVLDQLEFMGETKQEAVAIIQAGGDE